jgi:hypothetical protein
MVDLVSTGAQVRLVNGKLSVVDGPFVEAKEVIGGYAIFELPGKEEALASAKEFMQLHKDLWLGRYVRASCFRLENDLKCLMQNPFAHRRRPWRPPTPIAPFLPPGESSYPG